MNGRIVVEGVTSIKSMMLPERFSADSISCDVSRDRVSIGPTRRRACS
jgi:hypothetical protein